MVWEEEIFKGFLPWLLWQTKFFMEHNYLKEFERGPPKEHSCGIWLLRKSDGKYWLQTEGWMATDGRMDRGKHVHYPLLQGRGLVMLQKQDVFVKH